MRILNEKYDSIQSLFNDPEFVNSSVYGAIAKFRISGGEVLGEGTFGIVLTRPEWNFVLKIFVKDDSYLRFVRFAIKNPRKSYPKFFDIPRKIKSDIVSTPDDMGHERKIKQLYIVKTEKLFPISNEEYSDIEHYFVYKTPYAWMKYPADIVQSLKKIEKKYPGIEEFNNDFIYATRGITKPKNSDLKQTNIMKRSNGEFVFIDPFFNYDTSASFE